MGNTLRGSSGKRLWKRKRGSHPSKETTDKSPSTGNVVERSINDHQNGLLSVLECPVCMEIMKGTILQCSSGHSFCSNCIKQLTVCPLCKTSVSNPVRNFTLEKMWEQLTNPCPNIKHGCQERVLGKEDAHDNRCPFREYSCPISQDINTECSWKGARKHILEHVSEAHPRKVLKLQRERNNCFHYNLDNEFIHDVVLFHLNNDLFVSYLRYEKCRPKCWHTVQYLGPIEYASKFVYKISLAYPDKSRKITYSRNVHTEEEDIPALFATDDCFTVTEQQIQLFMKSSETHEFYYKLTVFSVL